MGTSTNYKAPTFPQWKNLKTKVTKLTNQGKLDPADIGEILHDFVTVNYDPSEEVSRGEGTASARAAQYVPPRARAAIAVAPKIGGFFALVNDIGFPEAFNRVDLGSLEGKSVREIVDLLLDYLGGPSGTLDQTDASTAIADLMEKTLEDADTPEDVEEQMEATPHGDDLIRDFFGYYIYEQFCRTHYERLVANVGDQRANECINQIRDYICEVLTDTVSNRDVSQIDWNGSKGQQIVADILRETLEVFSG